MTDPIRDTSALGAPGGVRRTTSQAPAGGQSDAAFQALFEQLERKSAELARDAQAVSGPEDLSRAVEGARSALEDALTIQARLLEATQQARHQSAQPGPAGSKGPRP